MRIIPVILIVVPVLLGPGIEARAATPGLVIGGTGAARWNITDLKPGDVGVQTVTLLNSSTTDGSLTLWVSDVVDSEGLNPTSETGNLAEPGELGNYVLFTINCINKSTNIAMPSTINRLPQSATDSRYIKIDPFPAGATYTLTWGWELPANTGNEVQGDRLSFSINYRLDMIKTTPPPSNGTSDPVDPSSSGGSATNPDTPAVPEPPPSVPTVITVQIAGTETAIPVNPDGSTGASQSGQPSGAPVAISIQPGTVINASGQVPDRITVDVTPPLNVPALPSGRLLASDVFSLAMYVKGERIEHGTFSEPFLLTMRYDTSKVPEGTIPFITFFDESTNSWTALDSFISSAGTVSAWVTHFSIFAVEFEKTESIPVIIDNPVIPARADIQMQSLMVTPSSAKPGEPVRVSAFVFNRGGKTGEYNVNLNIPGIIDKTMTVTVAPGATEEVTFTVISDQPGSFQVDVNNVKGNFTVAESRAPTAKTVSKWAFVWWSGAAILLIVIGLFTWAEHAKKRAERWWD